METLNPKNIITLYRDDVFMDETYYKFAAHPLTVKGVDKDGNEYVNFVLTDFNKMKVPDESIVIHTEPDMDETPTRDNQSTEDETKII